MDLLARRIEDRQDGIRPRHPRYAFGHPSMELEDWHREVRGIVRDASRKGPDYTMEAIRLIADKSLYFFLVYILGWTWMDSDFSYAFVSAVQRRKYGTLWVMAREHFKSTVITIGSTIWELVRHPGLTMVIYSYKDPAAQNLFYKPIRDQLSQCQDLKDLYPDVLWQDPEKEADVWQTEFLDLKGHPLRKEHTLEHASILAQKTGSHFDRGIYDDCVTQESCITPESIRKVKDAYTMSLNTLARGSRHCVIGTFYHYAELYNMIRDSGAMDVVVQPCYDPDGNPVRFTREELEKKAVEMGKAVFASQMLCDPKQASTMGFKSEWIQRWNVQVTEGLNVYLIVDPASVPGRKTDYTTMLVLGVDWNGNYMVIDMYRDKMNLGKRTDTLFSLYRRYHPLRVYYESVGNTDLEHIQAEMDHRSFHFPITGFGQWQAKLNRIETLQPDFEARRIWLPAQGVCVHRNWEDNPEDMVQSFIDQEYLAYPFMAHDDAIDCLANIHHPGITLQAPDQESTEERFRRRLEERGMRFGNRNQKLDDYEPY